MRECGKCGEKALKAATIELKAPIGGVLFTARAKGERCQNCGNEVAEGDVVSAFFAAATKHLAAHGPINGKTFVAMRKSLKMTAEAIGELLDVGAGTISRWEHGERDVDRSAWLVLAELVLHPGDRERMANVKRGSTAPAMRIEV